MPQGDQLSFQLNSYINNKVLKETIIWLNPAISVNKYQQ